MQASIGYIDQDSKSVVWVDLVNYYEKTESVLVNHYNTLNAAKMLVESGTISILKPQLQDSILHTSWGREKRVCRGTADLPWMIRHYADLQGDIDDTPLFVFDSISFIQDFTKYNDIHYHKQYGVIEYIDPNKSYWKKLIASVVKYLKNNFSTGIL